MELLRLINEWGLEIFGGDTRPLSEDELRQIAEDYVDVMRAISANRDGNGFIDIQAFGQDVLEAFIRLTGSGSVVSPGGFTGYNSMDAIHRLETFFPGAQWPMIDANMALGLTMNQAIPNSVAKNLRIGGIVLGTLGTAFTAPLWAPAAGRLILAAPSAAATQWDKFKQWMRMSRGSTGTTTPNSLNQQLSMQQVRSNPLQGATQLPITMTDPRWPATQGWVKMQQIINHSDGTRTTIHFVYNAGRQLFDDFKFLN